MSDLLLTTKLHIPATRLAFVRRPRLLERLDEGRQFPLALMSAPAGFGKTTLLGEWLQQGDDGGRRKDEQASERATVEPSSFIPHPFKAAWLSLDEDDNDGARFLTYFSAALDTLAPGSGELAQHLLQSAPATPWQPIMISLINALHQLPTASGGAGRPYVLVLDDYHVIDAQPIHEALTYFIERMPPRLHVVITSRADPPLPLSRWRARGQLVELRASDLRFTPDEAVQFLNVTMGLALSPADAQSLETRTEGWAAGLQLAALALRGRADPTAFLQDFTGGHRYILGYLIDEVVARQPASVQRFLLQTSVLERLTAPLCDALLDNGQWTMDDATDSAATPPASSVVHQPASASQHILEDLQRANLFTVALDERGEWYRYHHLFRDVLRLRLQQTQPDLIPTLHQRASAWYAQQGLLDEAIDHALSAQDVQRAGDLIVNAWFPLWKRGQLSTLQRWISQLPENAFRQNVDLALFAAMLPGWTGQLDLAEARLDAVEKLIATAPSSGEQTAETRRRLGWVAMVRAMLAARRGDVSEALRQADHAFGLLPPDDHIGRGGNLVAVGLAHLTRGELLEAQVAYEQAADQARYTDHWFLLIGALGRLAPVQITLGRLHAAAQSCRQMLALPIVRHGAVPAAGFAHVGLAEVHYQWDELEAAADHAATALRLGQDGGIVDLVYPAALAQARIEAARGQRDAAFAALAQARDTAPQVGGVHLARRVEAVAALIRLRLGGREAAERWERGGDHVDGLDPLVSELEDQVRARLRLAQGRPDEAMSLLDSRLAAAEADGRLGSVIEMRVLQARALAALGQSGAAVQALEQALALAEPEGYVRVFADEGAPMAELLRAVARQASAASLRPYIGRLLAALPTSEAREAAPATELSLSPGPPPTPLIEPLTERELEALRLVAEGKSNEQVASALVISIHTVRKHLGNIFGKLDVSSRTEAVTRARQLGLL